MQNDTLALLAGFVFAGDRKNVICGVTPPPRKFSTLLIANFQPFVTPKIVNFNFLGGGDAPLCTKP